MAEKVSAATALSVGLLMILSVLALVSPVQDASAHGTPHAPIAIDGDSALTPANGVVSGSGTELDPFIIEGWEIIPTSGFGLSISHTTSFIVVRSLHISSDRWESWGMGLHQVSNVSVEDSIVRTSGYDWYTSAYNFRVEDSRDVVVSNCTINGVHSWPLVFANSDRITVDECFIASPNGCLTLTSCSDFVIRGNTAAGTSYAGGLDLTGCDHGTVVDNDFWNDDPAYTVIIVSSSHDILFYHNNMYNVPDAYVSECWGLSWSAPYPDGGNYWSLYPGNDHLSGPGQNLSGSDGIIDTPCELYGLTDQYPLADPYAGTKHQGDYIELYVDPTTGLSTEIEIETQLEIAAIPVDMYGFERTGVTLTWSAIPGTYTIEKNTGTPYDSIMFTGHAAGFYELTVTDGAVSMYLIINVTLGLVAIEISPETVSVPFGSSLQFSAMGYNSHGAIAVTPFWDTSDDSTIDQTGLFSATDFSAAMIRNATDISPYVIQVTASQEGRVGAATVSVTLNATSDLDSDGIPDWWELKNQFDPFNSSDSALDVDNDQLTNLQEYENATMPRNAYSDFDVMPDGYELAHGLDPLDSSDALMDPDLDGLLNNDEYRKGTDPWNADTDGDQLPDGYEVSNRLNPLSALDAGLDSDSDGLTNLEEYTIGTSAGAMDSDGDFLPDGWEVAHALDPLNRTDAGLDRDGDSLSNLQEYLAGTDINATDTDSDGMPDGYEVSHLLGPLDPSDASADNDSDSLTNLQEYTAGTNPRASDTDGDSMPDGWELAHDLNPLNASDSTQDPDDDGLANAAESSQGTDPHSNDTDSDGNPDGWEVKYSLNPLDPSDTLQDSDLDGLDNHQEYANGTDPKNNDTDADAMPDGWELAHMFDPLHASDGQQDLDSDDLRNAAEFLEGTDPAKNDTDSDLMLDGWEVRYALDPLDPSDADEDADLDGLVNLAEFLNRTSVWSTDTDEDQLSDGFEVFFSKTNPADWDTDGDGVGDALEFVIGAGYSGSLEALPQGWIGMTIVWDNYSVVMRTNSSMLSGSFDKTTRTLSIDVRGDPGTRGALDLVVPKTLCNSSDVALALDNQELEFTMTQNTTHYTIHAEYSHSSHSITAQFMAGPPTDGPDGGLSALVIVAIVAAACIASFAVGWFLMGRRKGEP